jgi:hypothetical protein
MYRSWSGTLSTTRPGNKLIAAARAGEHLDPGHAVRVRVIEYEIPDRDGDENSCPVRNLITLAPRHHGPPTIRLVNLPHPSPVMINLS